MPAHSRVNSPQVKAQILGLQIAGFTSKRIAQILGLSRWSIKTFGRKRWANGGLENQPWVQEVRKRLAESAYTNAGAAMIQVADTLPSASALQAATIAGIMIDKAQVLQPPVPPIPQTITHVHLHAIQEAEAINIQLKALEQAQLALTAGNVASSVPPPLAQRAIIVPTISDAQVVDIVDETSNSSSDGCGVTKNVIGK